MEAMLHANNAMAGSKIKMAISYMQPCSY